MNNTDVYISEFYYWHYLYGWLPYESDGKKMRYIEKAEIIVTPIIDCDFADVALESAKMAIERDSTVSIVFNGAKYTISPLAIVDCFVETKGRGEK